MMQMILQGMSTGSCRDRAHSARYQNFPFERGAVPVAFSIGVMKEGGQP